MYDARVILADGSICSLFAPSVRALNLLICRLNEDVYVCGTLVKARDGKHPDYPNSYFAGYTTDGLAALFENKA